MAEPVTTKPEEEPAKPAVKKRGGAPTLTDKAEGFMHDNVYNESAGLKSGGIFAIVAAIGAAFMTGGDWLKKAVTALIVGVAAIFAAPVVGKAWNWTADKLGLPNHDNTPSIDKLKTPHARPSLEGLSAPVSGDKDKHLLASPILKNLKIPEGKHLSKVMQEYEQNISKAIVVAAHSTSEKQAEIDGKFVELKSRAGELSDGLVTWHEYEQKREEYMKKGGERDKLVAAVAERIGGDATALDRAERMIPVLPPVEVDDPNHPGSKMRLSLQHLVPLSADDNKHYEKAYDASPADKKRFGDKEWSELDPFSKQIFGLNNEVEHVRELRGDINTHVLNGRDSYFGDYKRREPLAEESVNFGRLNSNIPDIGNFATYSQDNASGAINYYLQQDPFAQTTKTPLPGTDTTNLGQLKAYIKDEMSKYTDEQKKNDDTSTLGLSNDKKAYDAYSKILEYTESLDRLGDRKKQMADISDVVDKLQGLGNSKEMVKAHDDAHRFVDQSLPKDINQEIQSRAAEAEKQRQEAHAKRVAAIEEAKKRAAGAPATPAAAASNPLTSVDPSAQVNPAITGQGKAPAAGATASK